ncbi:MAG: hypothetical protein KGD63_11880 [Candidatus Lokiarchaeota archaeon]|nr:hypothetical protein [Candidatus Lokiarchaeota archaeon]
MSLIDENGYTGRVDGGIGLMLNQPNVVFEASNSAKEFKIEAHKYYRESIEIINEKASKIFKKYNINNKNFHFNLIKYYPSHVGLGSKTQLSLAIANSIAKLKNLEINHRELTKIVERGGTSGIGWKGFLTGGFILDAGHEFGIGKEKENFLPSSASKSADPALTLLRYDIPENWRFVLTIPNIKKGAYGDEEVSIFKKYTPIPKEEVNEVSHQILMKIIPGLLKNDLDCFGEGLKSIQSIGFKKIEIKLQNKVVKDLLNFIDNYGAKAYGMSSFGPSVVGIVDSDFQAKKMLQAIQDHLKDIGGHFYICKPNNIGAKYEIIE